MVFGSLGLLTIITVAVGSLSLPVGVAVIVALIIASVKGSLVGGFFMHLIGEQRPIKWLLLLTLFFLLAMFLLISFSIMDQGGVNYVP
jgi:cytochrome c oxidase subunit 4